MSEPFSDLGDAISDQRFVDVDLALRSGRHIDHDDADWYAYLLDAQAVLELFYRRYGCELVHRSDGYFFLLPTGDKVAKRLLGVPEMVVGQGAALLYLDPATIESGGVVTKEDLLSHLAGVMGTDTLVAVFNPKRKRMDERLAQETVRQRVAEGLRKLTQLGFVKISEDNRLHLRSALMRFADPVRGAGSPRDALEKLIARGEVSIPTDPSEDIEDETSAEVARPEDSAEDPSALALSGEPTEGQLHEGAVADPWQGPGAESPESRETSARQIDGPSETGPDDSGEDEDEDALRYDSGADLDASFGIDFDEPPAKKTDPPLRAPTDAPPPPPSTPQTNAKKLARKRRRMESLHPEADGDSAAPGSIEKPKFDEID